MPLAFFMKSAMEAPKSSFNGLNRLKSMLVLSVAFVSNNSLFFIISN